MLPLVPLIEVVMVVVMVVMTDRCDKNNGTPRSLSDHKVVVVMMAADDVFPDP